MASRVFRLAVAQKSPPSGFPFPATAVPRFRRALNLHHLASRSRPPQFHVSGELSTYSEELFDIFPAHPFFLLTLSPIRQGQAMAWAARDIGESPSSFLSELSFRDPIPCA